jgi:hypothetical protein
MDLSSLKEQVSNLTLYDLKAGVRKVQNGTLNWEYNVFLLLIALLKAVMNYTEMEAKVIFLVTYPQHILNVSDRSGKPPTMNLGAHRPRSCKKLPMPHITSE